MHLPAMGAKLTVLTKEQSDYVPSEGGRGVQGAGQELDECHRVLPDLMLAFRRGNGSDILWP